MDAGDVSVGSCATFALSYRSSMDLNPLLPPMSTAAAPPVTSASSAYGLDALELLASAAGAAEPSPVAAYAPVASTSAAAFEPPATAAGKPAKAKKPRASKKTGDAGPGKGWRRGLKSGAAVKLEDGVDPTTANSPGVTPEVEDPAFVVEKKPTKKRAPPGQGKRALALAAKAEKIPKLSTDGTCGAIATAPVPTRVFPVGPMPKANPGVLQAQAPERGGPVVRKWQLGKRSVLGITGHTYELPTWQGADDSPYATSRRAALAAQAEMGSDGDYDEPHLPPVPRYEPADRSADFPPPIMTQPPPPVPPAPSPARSSLPPSLAALLS